MESPARVKLINVSSVKSTDIGEPVSVGVGALFSCRAPECKLKIPSGERNSPIFLCMGGIL